MRKGEPFQRSLHIYREGKVAEISIPIMRC